jgi:AhpD family alkylhydroperoxidase
MDSKVKELVALGASVSANCVSCVRYHLAKAQELGLTEEEILSALEVGKMVRRGAAGKMDEVLAHQVKGSPGAGDGSGCGSGSANSSAGGEGQ